MTGDITDTTLKPNSNPLQVIEHTYSNITKTVTQVIKISGRFDGIDNKLACESDTGNCFYDESIIIGTETNGGIPGVQYTISNKGKLIEVLSWGDIEYSTLNNMFYNAEGLFNIPNSEMPSVNYAIGTFYGCSNITELPKDFSLSNSLLNATEMFSNSGLSGTAIQNLEINSNLCVIDKFFYNCKNLTEKPKDFYKNKYKNVNYITGIDNTSAFLGTSIANSDRVN